MASRDASEMERAAGGCLSLTISAKAQLGAAPLRVADTNQWCVFLCGSFGLADSFWWKEGTATSKT